MNTHKTLTFKSGSGIKLECEVVKEGDSIIILVGEYDITGYFEETYGKRWLAKRCDELFVNSYHDSDFAYDCYKDDMIAQVL